MHITLRTGSLEDYFSSQGSKSLPEDLLHDRLPTRDNLNKRLTLASGDMVCCYCNEYNESTSHLFLHCSEVSHLWGKISNLIGVSRAPAGSISAHFSQFVGLLMGGKYRNRLGGLWFCVIWVLWR